MSLAKRIEIGSRLRECRAAAKLSPADAAQAVDCSAKTIYAIEAGSRPLEATRLAALCLVYGVSSDYLLFGTHMVPEDLRHLFARSLRKA